MVAYLVAVGIVALIYMLLTIGLNLQYGYTGLINFGVVAFFAIGAYASALLTLRGWPMVPAFVVAIIVAAIVAYPIGLLSLRLSDDYLAVVTLGFSEAVRLVIQEEKWLTHGVQGLPGDSADVPVAGRRRLRRTGDARRARALQSRGDRRDAASGAQSVRSADPGDPRRRGRRRSDRQGSAAAQGAGVHARLRAWPDSPAPFTRTSSRIFRRTSSCRW